MSTAMQLMHSHSSCSCISQPNLQTSSEFYPNVELSPAEKAHVSHSLSDLQHLLDRHDFELARLRDVITFLSTSQEALARRMEDVKSLVAPINALPDEILAEILRMHFLTQMEEIRYRSYGRIRIPLGFTRVCKRWRGVALESPRIWADVTAFGDMHVPANEGLSEAIFVRDLMNMFLSRSRHASLKVKLGLSTSQLRTKSSSRIVAPLLLAQSMRWGEADVDVDLEGDDLIPDVLHDEGNRGVGYIVPGLHGAFPLLKRLALGGKFASSSQRWRWQESPDAIHSPPPAISVQNASLLTHLTLNLRAPLTSSEMARAIDVPWHQIRTLKCNYSFGNLESLLRLCTNVQEVEVNAVFRASSFHNDNQLHHTNQSSSDSQEDYYTCESLRRMSLNVALPSCTGVKGLLRHLRTPRLTSLDLTFIPSSSDSFPPSATGFTPTSISTFLSDDLVSFFSRSHGPCQLTHLALRNVPKFQSCAETLVTLFHNTPELTELQLEFQKAFSSSEYPVEESDLEDFEMEQDSCSLVNFFNELRSTPILPTLKHLRIENLAEAKFSSGIHSGRNLETEALFDMLETRREGLAVGSNSCSIVARLEEMHLGEELVSLVL
ncbi:hypothetical protein DFH05DRAFT_621893 [Lentinula detonsa]|uniref:F-box domain-containing protein n=1 Tax=Lentinula detonsa TaxID=2804962 RepID=A0A9W8P8G1_9AGAR|nr:hypothetical protein DFH05DRAFT_621893 [Lentinula detonsa]